MSLDWLSNASIVAPMILETLRNPIGLLATLWSSAVKDPPVRKAADEIMTLCRMDKRKSRLSTAETLRAIVL